MGVRRSAGAATEGAGGVDDGDLFDGPPLVEVPALIPAQREGAPRHSNGNLRTDQTFALKDSDDRASGGAARCGLPGTPLPNAAFDGVV